MQGIVTKKLVVQKGETTILDQLSCEFKQGTFSLLTGDSGCGKTTLLHTIAGFDGTTYLGEIFVNNHNTQQLTTVEKAQQIGIMFQNPSQQFTMRTLQRELMFVMENFNLPIAESNERMARAVQEMQMGALLHRELVTLSGGEKQRAALTILLALDPPIFLLDEPFASIDPDSRMLLIKKLASLRDKGKLIVVADHELNGYQPYVDRFIRMTNGQLKEQSLDELTSQPQLGSLRNPDAPVESLFELQNFSLFQGEKELLIPQNFQFKKGITTLTGVNGTGKSTLLRAMVQLQAYKGLMYFDGQKLSRHFGKRKLYEKMTLAVQQAEQQFVTLQVDKELNFPKEPEEKIKQKQLAAMKTLGIDHVRERSLYQLSEGQKKMIQLIAMLSLDCTFLLLDEPFTGLDERACQFFVKWLEEKKQRTSLLIVSHRLEPLVGVSDHHVHLANQQLQEVDD